MIPKCLHALSSPGVLGFEPCDALFQHGARAGERTTAAHVEAPAIVSERDDLGKEEEGLVHRETLRALDPRAAHRRIARVLPDGRLAAVQTVAPVGVAEGVAIGYSGA